MTQKTYLGDSVYASYDGWMVTLYLDNGLGQHTTIYLEPTVLRNLFTFATKVKEEPQNDDNP